MRWRWVFLSLFLFRVISIVAQQSVPDADYLVVMLKGTARVARGGAQVFERLSTNEVVRIGDRVRVYAESQLALRNGHLQIQRYDENSDFLIEAPLSATTAKTRIRLFSGFMSFFHRDKPTDAEVETQSVSTAVRGTEFTVQVEADGTTTVTVMDGIVDLTNAQTVAPVTLTDGEQAVTAVGQAPVRRAAIDTINVIQWTLYYPGVLDVRELPLSDAERTALDSSITAYESGDILAALALYPANRVPQSDAERIYRATLLLAVGQVDDSQPLLSAVNRASGDTNSRLAAALEQMIAVVKQRAGTPPPPELGTEWMVESYRQQSLANLEEALAAARHATEKSPVNGFAWARVAELEFSFGRRDDSTRALERALDFSPRNAQAITLNGFLYASRNKIRAAISEFERAIAIDPGLANAWVGRGLCRIRSGDRESGRDDLLTAAALEPNRAVLRSYLGKAWTDVGDRKHAEHELQLAKDFDPRDPTAWLYSALLREQQNRLNESVADLEQSQSLNTNRFIYRSQFLLDQDRAVRSANLARIYEDAGLKEVAVREAARSVAAEYGNYSAHYFLANSYNALRRANRSDLRFESAAFGEYLLANLMGPADGSLLAQPISENEYTPLFERNRLGFSSITEYFSRGAWTELAVQHGTFGNSSYALEGDYLWDPGYGPNAFREERVGSASFKQMLTPDDGLYVEGIYFSQDAGDISRKYDPAATVDGLHTREEQLPTILVGLDHQWNEANRTLFLYSHVDASLHVSNPKGSTYLLANIFGNPLGLFPTDLTQQFEADLSANSFEFQHVNRSRWFQTIFGLRFQDSTYNLFNQQIADIGNVVDLEPYFGNFGDTITQQSFKVQAQRVSPYLYTHWNPTESLWLIGGLSYDYQHQPNNLYFAPVSAEEEYVDQFSPKAGLVWTPTSNSAIRAAYTRSLTGVTLDQSLRLEPTQIAGFVQTYRDLIPEGLGTGSTSGNHLETIDFSLEYRFPTRTYIALAGQALRSNTEHEIGAFDRDLFTSQGPAVQLRQRLKYEENSVGFDLHQLIGEWFGIAYRYRVSEAELETTFPSVNDAFAQLNNDTSRGLYHTLYLQHIFRHPSGFFASADALWWFQELGGGLNGLPDDRVWQFNLFAGYRSPKRRVEVTVGVLNITDQDYRFHPINLYSELPRERTFYSKLQISF